MSVCVCVCNCIMFIIARLYTVYVCVNVFSFFSNTSTHKISFTLIRLSCGIIRRGRQRKRERERKKESAKKSNGQMICYMTCQLVLSPFHTFAYLIKQRHKKEHGDEEDEDEDFNSISFQFLAYTHTHTHTIHLSSCLPSPLTPPPSAVLLSVIPFFGQMGGRRIRRNLSSNLDSGNDERRCRVFIKHLTHTHRD